MSPPRKYANPPVVEALCEVYFAEARWDETVPGRFYDRARQELGFTEKEPVTRHEAQFAFGGASGPSADLREETRMRFRSADRTRVVQVEPDLLVVNQLRPYPTFEDWAPSVVAAAKVFTELVPTAGVTRLCLRYINQIDIPGARTSLGDWFEVVPQLPPAWQDTAGQFLVRVERKVDENLGLILTFGSAPTSKPGESSFLLDIYCVCSLPTPVQVDAIGALMEKAHSAIEDVFEGSITERLRSRFSTSEP